MKPTNQWTEKIEKVLKGIEKKCNIYKNKHNQISVKAEKTYSYLMIASIIITPISGILNTIGSMITNNIEMLFYFTTTSTIFSFTSGIIISITKFSQYEQVSKSHLTASTRYTSLEHNIQRQLLLERKNTVLDYQLNQKNHLI
jgi:cytochrome b subunit of formate dehydrogenase